MNNFNWIEETKLYKATYEANNSCYVISVIVHAIDEKDAHEKICEYAKREVKYNQSGEPQLIEKIGVVTEVGFAASDY